MTTKTKTRENTVRPLNNGAYVFIALTVMQTIFVVVMTRFTVIAITTGESGGNSVFRLVAVTLFCAVVAVVTAREAVEALRRPEYN